MTDNPRNVSHFFGLALIIIGVLWLGLSGLCAATMLYSMITESASHQELLGWAVLVVTISGISGAMAFGVLIVGRGLWRSK
jgi:hypothetical protein